MSLILRQKRGQVLECQREGISSLQSSVMETEREEVVLGLCPGEGTLCVRHRVRHSVALLISSKEHTCGYYLKEL